jgi:hypothetical protein
MPISTINARPAATQHGFLATRNQFIITRNNFRVARNVCLATINVHLHISPLGGQRPTSMRGLSGAKGQLK